jgi:hypothetical protein
MKRITIAAASLLLSTVSAFAQNAPAPATPATGARPATTAPAPATPATALPGGTTAGARGSNIATTAADARTIAQARQSARETACRAKGSVYEWKAPHNIGDARPGGGFYTTNSGGSCRAMSLSNAMAKGLVTVKQ